MTNPVGFTSAEILRLLNKHRDSGKNYKEVDEWLNVMSSTTIISEGAVYFAGKKVWAKDRFHVFDRAVSFGRELAPGKIADKNYVWLSEWQLDNINNNYLMPIDLETYRHLKNHIAKALVPLLQIWLFASRDDGYFEKRYEEICQILNVHQYRQPSRIKEQLTPSLDELKTHNYLSGWRIEKTSEGKRYKVILYHSDKFHRDQRRRLSQKEQATAPVRPPVQETTIATSQEPQPEARTPDPLVVELTKRGISESTAKKLLQNLAEDQEILDQL